MLTNMQSLSLKIVNVNRENDLPVLPPNLTHLSLGGVFYGKCLRRLSTLKNLRRLELHHMNERLRSVVDKLHKLLQYPLATSLQELVLHDYKAPAEDVIAQLVEFKRLSQLTRLSIASISTKGFEMFMSMTNIRHLSLGGYPEYQYHPSLCASTRLTQLRRLTLRHELKNASEIFAYSLPNLEHLSINGYYLHEDNFPAQMNLTALTRLDLVDNRLTGNPLEMLQNITSLTINFLPRHSAVDD